MAELVKKESTVDQLQQMVFDNADFGEVRTVVIDGEPWFVSKDVADCLGYSNSRDAISKHVFSEDKDVAKCDTPSGRQKYVNRKRIRIIRTDFWKQVRESKRVQEMGNFRSASNIKENRTL